MIIPTAEYDGLFAQDGIPFREKMTQYIRREFRDVLGPRVQLLNSPDGLEQLAAIYAKTRSAKSASKAA